MPLHQSIVESTPYLLKKRKNNINSCPKIYAYKESITLNPLMLVDSSIFKKKDGKSHPVQDYRNLNKWMIPNKYPLPLILELIYDLAEKCLFSKFDI